VLNPERARRAAPRITRLPPSLRQEYQEFILQRLEEYKNTIAREELLEIGDEAVRELELSGEGQYLLTEVLLLEHVDRIIARRLRLPSFRRWSQKHRALRLAQREPTHWGLSTEHILVRTAPRLAADDLAVIIGAGALAAALFVAAHDHEVFLVDQDLGAIEGVESRAVSEQLGGRFQALVIQLGGWFPDLLPGLVVLDPVAMADLGAAERHAFLADLQARTRAGGFHVVLPVESRQGVIPLAPEALQAEYGAWQVERRRRGARAGFVATKPPRQGDTPANVSD